MNREKLEKLEKMIDNEFCKEYSYHNEVWNYIDIELFWKIKYFIFDELIKEVLESIIEEDDFIMVNGQYFKWYTDKINKIKQKAKELYWITL